MGVVRKTKSVGTIMGIFQETENALSVVELVVQLKIQMNKTTVYRVLERLENQGFVHSFTDGKGLTWYAKCQGCCYKYQHHDIHPHFQCKRCGKVECLSKEIHLPSFPNHQVDSAEILLFGECEECLGD